MLSQKDVAHFHIAGNNGDSIRRLGMIVRVNVVLNRTVSLTVTDFST